MAQSVDLRERAPARAAVAAHEARTPPAKRAKAARRRLDPAIRSELILDEALRLFAERHYGVVTVRDIAEACGINPALIYYYFDNKDHLFRRALGHAIERMMAGYEARRPEGGDPAREMMTWLDTSAAIAPTLSRMVKIMADYAASNARDAATDGLIRGFYAKEQGLFEDCIARGIAAGRFRPVNVPTTARTISLHLDGIFHASASRGDDRIAADIDDLRDLIATLLGLGDAIEQSRLGRQE